MTQQPSLEQPSKISEEKIKKIQSQHAQKLSLSFAEDMQTAYNHLLYWLKCTGNEELIKSYETFNIPIIRLIQKQEALLK